MRQQISPPMIVGAVVLLVIVLALMGWKAFSASSPIADEATIKAHQALKQKTDR